MTEILHNISQNMWSTSNFLIKRSCKQAEEEKTTTKPSPAAPTPASTSANSEAPLPTDTSAEDTDSTIVSGDSNVNMVGLVCHLTLYTL